MSESTLGGGAGRPVRYHAMDSLRGAMMLLGVALHAAVAYMSTPLGELWDFKDAHTHFGFDVFVAVVHTFRMPVFFVMAGFFAALLVYQRGAREMLRNRARRVLVPLVIGWLVLFPLTVGGFAFAQFGGTARAAHEALRYAASSAALEHLQLMHLWFLSDLLLYYAVALLVCRLLRVVPDNARHGVARGFGQLLRRWYAPVLLAVPTVLTLVPMQSGMLETPGTFLRPPATLAAHGVFFTFGWLLYLRRDLIGCVARHAGARTFAACALFPLHGMAVVRLAEQADPVMRGLSIVSLALTIWLFVFGLTGLFVRYLAQPHPRGRYVADASYWFYLVHLPLVVWGSGLLASLTWPAGVKYVVLLAAVVVVCGVTYDAAVRPTIVGVFLNGRRYPRGLPASTPREVHPSEPVHELVSTTPAEPHAGSSMSAVSRRSIDVQR